MPRRKINPRWLAIILMPLVSVTAAILVLVATSESGLQDFDRPSPTLVPVEHELVGQAAPNFELARLNDDAPLRLSSLRGRVVFVNFWATWCEPCRREMPTLQTFGEANQGRAAPVVLAVNIGDTVAQINDFMAEINVALPYVLLDYDFSVSDTYEADFYPSTFVIDPAGHVAAFHLGEITLDDLDGYVADLS